MKKLFAMTLVAGILGLTTGCPATDTKPTTKGTTGSVTPPPKAGDKDKMKPETKPEVKPDTKPETKPDAKPETKPDAKPEDKGSKPKDK